jgi:hypothetical protein
MAFKRCGSLDGAQDPIEYLLLTDGEGATLGQTLVSTSGRLTSSAVDTTVPQFVALATRVLEATSVTPLPVERLREDVEYETKSMATVAATLIGTKVTLHTDRLLVTATTSNGTFEISATDGATTTSKVKGYFRR